MASRESRSLSEAVAKRELVRIWSWLLHSMTEEWQKQHRWFSCDQMYYSKIDKVKECSLLFQRVAASESTSSAFIIFWMRQRQSMWHQRVPANNTCTSNTLLSKNQSETSKECHSSLFLHSRSSCCRESVPFVEEWMKIGAFLPFDYLQQKMSTVEERFLYRICCWLFQETVNSWDVRVTWNICQQHLHWFRRETLLPGEGCYHRWLVTLSGYPSGGEVWWLSSQ